MALEGTLPHSKAHATCPYPQPDQSSSCLPIKLLADLFKCYPPIYAQVFQVVSFPRVPNQNSARSSPVLAISLLNLITRMKYDEEYTAHSKQHRVHSTQHTVHSTQLLVMQSSPLPSHLVPPRPKCFPHTSVLNQCATDTEHAGPDSGGLSQGQSD